jgi:hypothetical protein
MKVWIIVLSLLAAAITCYWGLRQLTPAGRTPRQFVSLVVRSLAVGVGVYFLMMAVALVYLMFTH